MSRTRKTAPGVARMLSNPARLTMEVHDHRNGICDLEENPNGPDRVYCYGDRGKCHRGPSREFWFGRDSGCPCWMCHESEWHYRGRRRVRREARERARRAVKVLNGGGDLDEEVVS